MRSKLCSALFALCAVCSVQAMELPDKLYAGGSYSAQKFDYMQSGSKFQTLGATLGYQFNDYFSLESRFNVGISGRSSNYNFPESIRGDYREDIREQSLLAVKFSYPVLEKLKVYGMAGYARTDLEFDLLSVTTPPGGNESVLVPIQITDKISGASYGLGLSLQTASQVELYLDYQILPEYGYPQQTKSRWSALTLGVNYHF